MADPHGGIRKGRFYQAHACHWGPYSRCGYSNAVHGRTCYGQRCLSQNKNGSTRYNPYSIRKIIGFPRGERGECKWLRYVTYQIWLADGTLVNKDCSLDAFHLWLFKNKANECDPPQEWGR